MPDTASPNLELFQLLDTLARPAGGSGSGLPAPTPSEADAALADLAGGGRVFRVKLGYNPNSSSLGTSVVVLLWGIGLAGVLFTMVGAWLMSASDAPPALPPGDDRLPSPERP
jgi:hypothetical protein